MKNPHTNDDEPAVESDATTSPAETVQDSVSADGTDKGKEDESKVCHDNKKDSSCQLFHQDVSVGDTRDSERVQQGEKDSLNDSSCESPCNSSAKTHQDSSQSCEGASVEDQLAEQVEKNDELKDQLAHVRADLYNVTNEYQNYVRRAKEAASGHYQRGQAEVLEALIGVLDDIHAAREAGDLDDGPFAAIASKLETTLETRFQLVRYGKVGDEFNPQLHEALLAKDNAEVDVATVGQVLQPGYKHHDTVLRPTKVSVDNPVA